MSELPTCRVCGHVHDPETGRCDAHAHVGIGPCPCPGEDAGRRLRQAARRLIGVYMAGRPLADAIHALEAACDEDEPA